MNLIEHLTRQREFSLRTFGPGPRTEGVCKHIEKELQEVREARGGDLSEWIDIGTPRKGGCLVSDPPPRGKMFQRSPSSTAVAATATRPGFV